MTAGKRRHVPFICPRCGQPMARVVDTRERQGAIWRRRVCPAGHSIETREQIAA
jgi:transcriptional regulator NrdR family protein